ncbi:MAG TPA: hypothetical protein VEC38_13775 [Candidatus Binataceae bacterium]|nr:hypothetical protein [Candidatus Binataceae bacterium]
MAVKKTQAEPRTFSLHWGSGIIEEEVRVATAYHVPAIQLLKFTEGITKGSYEIRFCAYDHRGRFQRMPLIIGEDHIAKLRNELKKAPKLKRMLARLVR